MPVPDRQTSTRPTLRDAPLHLEHADSGNRRLGKISPGTVFVADLKTITIIVGFLVSATSGAAITYQKTSNRIEELEKHRIEGLKVDDLSRIETDLARAVKYEVRSSVKLYLGNTELTCKPRRAGGFTCTFETPE